MLFHLAFRKELTRTFGATLVILITVVMSVVLIRTLGLATKGWVAPTDVMLVMGYTLLSYLPILLSLCLFIAAVSTLSRMYADSEMAIWHTAGQGLASFLRPLVIFAAPVVIVIAVLSLVGWPWANQHVAELRNSFQSRNDLDRVQAGQFQESADGSRVFFIDKHSEGALKSQNIFVATNENGIETTITARTGHLQTMGETQYLVLSDGQRVENFTAKPEVRITEFKELAAKIGRKPITPGKVEPREIYPWDLVKDFSPRNQAELIWRIGLIFAALNFMLVALALTQYNPRAGRSGSLLISLFTFVLYFNLITLGNNWIGGGKVNAGVFVVLLHGGAFLLFGLLLQKRHINWSFRHVMMQTS